MSLALFFPIHGLVSRSANDINSREGRQKKVEKRKRFFIVPERVSRFQESLWDAKFCSLEEFECGKVTERRVDGTSGCFKKIEDSS